MTRRKLLLVLAGLAVLICGAGAFVAWPRPDRVTEGNFHRIREGMTRAEVEAILGPPGDYTTGPVSYSIDPPDHFYRSGEAGVADWHTDTAFVQVIFDASGKTDKYWIHPGNKEKQSLVDEFLWPAKRQWLCWFPD